MLSEWWVCMKSSAINNIQKIRRLFVFAPLLFMVGCGGSGSSENNSQQPGGEITSEVTLTAQPSLSSFKVGSSGVVNLAQRVQSTDTSTQIHVTDVHSLESNGNCTIESVNTDNFVVSATQPTACYFEYTVSDQAANAQPVSAISQVTFQPSGVAASTNGLNLAPAMVSVEQGQCQEINVGSNLPANTILDSSVVVIGSGTAVVEDAEQGLINYCSQGRGYTELYYSAIDGNDNAVYTGAVDVAISVDANTAPIANNFSYYYNPAQLIVKIPANTEVTLDVKDYISDADEGDQLQLIDVRVANATIALANPSDLTNTQFTFRSQMAGTYYVTYHVVDHMGGHSIGMVKLEVDSPYQDYYVDTGDVQTSFTLSAPITLAEIQQYGMAYIGQQQEGIYTLATFNYTLADAICEARGGVLASRTDFVLALSANSNITSVTGWPATWNYITGDLNPNGNGLDTVAAWDNSLGNFIEQDTNYDQGYFSCRSVKPRDFAIRDPHYVIAGTVKDLVATYTNSAGSNQFYTRGIDWSSSDTSVLEIDASSGRAEGMKKGTVIVTARSIDGELIATLEVDVIDEIPVFGMGSLNDQSENGFNMAVEKSRDGDTIAANAILRDTQNFGPSGATVKLKATWKFETANDRQFGELRDALQREYPPAIVQIGYPNQPDETTTNALRDFLYNGGVLMYFSQDRGPTERIMRSIFGEQADANTFTGSGGVFKFDDIDDPVIKGPFGDLANQYWGLDQSQVAYAYNLPEGTYVPFTHTYDESRGWDAGGSIQRTGVTSLRHKTLKFIWTGDAGFFGFHTNDPQGGINRTDAYPLMVADYNSVFEDGDYRPVPKLNYGSNTKFAVSNSIFFANAVTWLFGAAPSATR